MYLIVDTLAELWLAIVILYHIQSFVDRLFILQREYQPAAKQSATHRRYSFIDNIQQRLSVFLHRINQLQTTDGELIQSHVLIFFDTRYRGDMTYLCVLGLFKVLQNSSCSDDS